MLVYDVTSEKTFDNIRNWIRNIEEVCGTLTTSEMRTPRYSGHFNLTQ